MAVLETYLETFWNPASTPENINDYNRNRKRKILIVFDGMIADIMINKKFQAIIK